MEYILNGLPLVGEADLRIRRATLAEIRQASANGAVSLIGHESTARALGVPYNRGSLTSFIPGDVLYIARLRTRLPESGDIRVQESDLDVYQVRVLDLIALSEACSDEAYHGGTNAWSADHIARLILGGGERATDAEIQAACAARKEGV